MERRLGIMAFALAAWLASTSTGTSAADAAACEEARARAAALRADLDRSIGPKARPFFAGAGRSAATWEAYAGEAYALGGFRAALWGELNALDREWRPRSVSRAGVYLEKLGRAPEASRFLECARALGYRSPYLLEALASARLRSGDKMGATTAIREAQQMAPGDVLIDAERSIIETGRPPQPPRKDDALGQALRDLERHVAAVKAAMRHRQELQKRIDATLGIRNDSGPFPPEAERQVDRQMDEVRYWVDQVRLPLDEVTRRHPDRPAQRVQAERAAARYAAPPQLIDAYFRATERLLGYEWGLGPTGQHELLLWADVLDLDPLAYAREIHDAAHVDGTDALAHYRGTQARLASLQGPALLAVSHPSDAAKAKLDEGMVRCGHQYPAGSQSSQLKACELAEQSAYCTTMRALYDRWTKAAQARYAIAGRQFDRVATRREAWAAQQLADALAFARRVMKGFKRGDPAARAVAGAMNRDYRRLAEIALGNGSAGPAAVIRESAGWYRRDRADAEADQASAAASLAEMCAPVERRVLEALAEQHSKEVLDMLRARFLRDFNVAYEDAAHCEFEIGPISASANDEGRVTASLDGGPLTATVDQDGKVTVQGSSKLESEVGEEPESHGSGEAQEGGGAKPELSAGMSYASDGTWAASVSGKVDADYEGFVPEASAEISAVYDPAKRSWETRVHASTAMGMGVSLGGASLECFPGEVSVEFEPRAVLDDAAAYVDALSRT